MTDSQESTAKDKHFTSNPNPSNGNFHRNFIHHTSERREVFQNDNEEGENMQTNRQQQDIPTRGRRIFLHSLSQELELNAERRHDISNPGISNDEEDHPIITNNTNGGARPSNNQSILQNQASSRRNETNPPSLRENDEHSNYNSTSFNSMTPYYVPDDDIVIQLDVPAVPSSPHTHPTDSNSPPESFPIIDPTIPQAISIISSWTDKPFFQKFPCLTYGHLLTCSFIFVLVCTTIFSLLLSSPIKESMPLSNTTLISSMAPSITPLISEWHNDTLININAYQEKPNINLLLGYSVSLSSDGNTLAVGGSKTFQIYSYSFLETTKTKANSNSNNSSNSAWIKVFDMNLADNVMGEVEFSWETVVALSSDGHYVVVGDRLASNTPYEGNGVVIIFTNVDEGGEVVQWYQLGPTISGHNDFARFGESVAIADGGKNFAMCSNNKQNDSTIIYDYDGYEWIEKMKIEPGAIYDGVIVLSPNGNLFAISSSGYDVVYVYDLTTFTELQTMARFNDVDLEHRPYRSAFDDFGHSMSFSHDGTILAISSWSMGAVDLYRFNPQTLKYLPMRTSITIANETGLGHSVSVSANGKYVAVGAVSHPSYRFVEVGEFDDAVFWKDSISERGSVFVFRIGDNDNDDWEEVGYFEHDVALYDKIGWSVSISGSGDVIAFGGYGTGGKRGDGANKIGQAGVYRSNRVTSDGL